jgi:hypothetical protein
LTILLVFQTSCGKKIKENKTKDFTEINKLLANGYKHFQNEEALLLFQQSKNAEIKKILQNY